MSINVPAAISCQPIYAQKWRRFSSGFLFSFQFSKLMRVIWSPSRQPANARVSFQNLSKHGVKVGDWAEIADDRGNVWSHVIKFMLLIWLLEEIILSCMARRFARRSGRSWQFPENRSEQQQCDRRTVVKSRASTSISDRFGSNAYSQYKERDFRRSAETRSSICFRGWYSSYEARGTRKLIHLFEK